MTWELVDWGWDLAALALVVAATVVALAAHAWTSPRRRSRR